MKRLVSLILALAMLLCACAVASAEALPVITVAVADTVNVEDFNTNWTTLYMEEQLGVDLQFEVYPSTDYNTKINMMIATGGSELPDVLFVTPSESELITWIDSGVLVPMTEYWEDAEKSPYLHDAIQRTGVDIASMCRQYDGEIYYIPSFNQTYNSEYPQKAWINTSWMETLNMSAPTTPDELYDLLVAVKNNDLNGNGKNDEIGMVGTFSTGSYDGWFRYIMNSFVYAGQNDFFTVEDGQVGYAYATEQWKEGIKFIRKLFEENLLPKEILTQDGDQFLAMLNSEECTTMMFFYSSASRVNAGLAWRDDFEGYAPLINQASGKPLSTYRPSVPNNGCFFITKNCPEEYRELAFSVGDLMVSQYLSIVTRWGQEGEDWDYIENVENGDKYTAWVDGFDVLLLVYDDAKFWSSGEMQNRSYIQRGPYIREYGIANGRAKDPETSSLFDKHVNAADTLYQESNFGPEETIAKLIYTAEEIETVTDIHATLADFVREWNANFMAGNLDIDANWDAYLEELNNIGMQQSLEVVQGVYDRMYK